MGDQSRDVTSGESTKNLLTPSPGLANYILGVLTGPIEVFIRRDFGERYFTLTNFIGGLVFLILWLLGSYAIRMLNVLNSLSMLNNSLGGTGEVTSEMPVVIKYYIIFGIIHFLRIWWRNITGAPLHSFASGHSWLRAVGSGVMFFMNWALNNILRLIFSFRKDKERLSDILPVLRDVDTFTERYIEPIFLLLLTVIFFSAGQYTVACWLFFSVIALSVSTSLRHQAERSYVLDLRDQLIDARLYHEFLIGNIFKGENSQERIVIETAREAERNPEVLSIIEAQNPSLARAIERISPKLKAITDLEDVLTDQELQSPTKSSPIMDFDPTELIKTLGSLASIASGYLNVRKALVESGRARRSLDGGLEGTLTSEETKSILEESSRASATTTQDQSALQIISPDLLESATERMRRAHERFINVVREGQISEIEEEQAITRREVCYFLSIILEHNRGLFPQNSNLENIWRQFRCTALYPQFGIRSGS